MPWYHNTFLGKGNFVNNTWVPTTAALKVETRNHPSTTRLPERFTSSVSEWYSWSRDLRQNPDIQVLASVDPSSFPLGTDPNQQWRSGYYPIMWTNKNFKMIYANFGHNAMDYQNNIPKSSTFASAAQNTFLIDSLLWLGDGGTPPPQTPWQTLTNKGNAKCVDARAAGIGNRTVIQQYSCNSSTAQQFRAVATSDGISRLEYRNNASLVLDMSNVSTTNGAGIHPWTYGGGNNQRVHRGAGSSYRLSAGVGQVPRGALLSGEDAAKVVVVTALANGLPCSRLGAGRAVQPSRTGEG